MIGIAFTIPGEARGKGRPRTTTIGGRARLYTDAKTASYENLVRLAGSQAMAGREPFEEPLTLTITVSTVPPKSYSKKLRAAMLAGDVMPAKKPDLSNILKAVEDGLNGVAYRDDAQIVRLTASKTYALTPGVDVEVRPINFMAGRANP